MAQQRRRGLDDVRPGEQILGHVVACSTPVLAASEARIRPCSNAIHVSGKRVSAGVDSATVRTVPSVSGSMSGCRNRLNSTSPSAPAASSRCAMSAVALK